MNKLIWIEKIRFTFDKRNPRTMIDDITHIMIAGTPPLVFVFILCIIMPIFVYVNSLFDPVTHITAVIVIKIVYIVALLISLFNLLCMAMVGALLGILLPFTVIINIYHAWPKSSEYMLSVKAIPSLPHPPLGMEMVFFYSNIVTSILIYIAIYGPWDNIITSSITLVLSCVAVVQFIVVFMIDIEP